MSSSKTALVRLSEVVVRRAEELGVDRARLLAEAQVTESELADPDARIQSRKVLAIWRAVLDAIPDPDLGIELAERFELRDAGLVGYLMLHSPTLGEALSRLKRFFQILDESLPGTVQADGDRVEYALDPLPEQLGWMERAADYDLGAVLSAVRELTGVDIEPLEVHLHYRKPDRDLKRLHDLFRAPIHYDQAKLKLVFSRRSLDLPVAGAEAELGRYLESQAETVLGNLAPEGSMAERAERALWAGMKEGLLALEDVASTLAVSPRTLQRRLREEGLSFVEVRDAFREQMALTLLEGQDLAVYEVAFLLGYSEPSSFYRAFRRWVGTTPQEFRAEAHAGS